jgi:DNA-binding HxlR family transcriptional regulator
VPRTAWNGYERFCPLARALDVVGERWTLVIVQELQKRSMRYGELGARLPGIGTSLLADRLRKLEAAGVVERRAGAVGDGVSYELTERGRELEPALRALREWGAQFLFDPAADGAAEHEFDLRYVDGVEQIPDGAFQLAVDGKPAQLRFRDGHLTQRPGHARMPEVAIETDAAFVRRWAAGELDWEEGRADGAVRVKGPERSWVHWLGASGYLLRYPPAEEADDGG